MAENQTIYVLEKLVKENSFSNQRNIGHESSCQNKLVSPEGAQASAGVLRQQTKYSYVLGEGGTNIPFHAEIIPSGFVL